ncbi:amphoterin-induced protein 1-like [Solea senegalensis]|uniref:Amphoterin-induced protein 1-like n=1 Tax=Solea senegalensis TaxID=28829 RepID=A0AAV6SUR4_SOLSE|nr:amphoterin-induced protein 1 [Solea senegalensis]XP_043894853.1 amphoterin-induced protein 1 [Solea senegalensis]KAG7520333.1 amphoterin-induced protein 1-like [Solea senegalensis]
MLQPSTRTGDCLLETLPHQSKHPKWVLFLTVCVAVLCLPGAAATTLNCHKTCICASNIVSCSKMNLTTVPTLIPNYTGVLDLSYNEITKLLSEWTPIVLPKLHNLLLSHNGLFFLSSEAFIKVKNLRYLDLSSNSLRQLDEFIFEPLANLEVLLLYNNLISQIDRSAFVGVINLQKLYLSQNQISRFPLELVKEKSRLERLSLLDVSSNKIKLLPIEELKALPAWLKNGLYFHNNPLPCHCDLYTLLAHWYLRKLNSAVDFKDDYTCILPGLQKKQVAVFDLSGETMNCSTFKEAGEEAFLEQILTLSCDTKHRDMSKTWTLPGNVPVIPGSNQTAKVLPDGSLQISSVRSDDSGTYTCFAMSEAINETIYVVLKVHNLTMHGSGETLNTAYTTLVGCLASVVLVLMYLYLTPCRCFCCPSKGKTRGEDSIHSSMLSVTPTHEDPALKAELNKHVAFIDSKDLQGQNGKLNPNGNENDDDDLDAEAGSLMKGKRKKSVAESISSVFSDTPMVV